MKTGRTFWEGAGVIRARLNRIAAGNRETESLSEKTTRL